MYYNYTIMQIDTSEYRNSYYIVHATLSFKMVAVRTPIKCTAAYGSPAPSITLQPALMHAQHATCTYYREYTLQQYNNSYTNQYSDVQQIYVII